MNDRLTPWLAALLVVAGCSSEEPKPAPGPAPPPARTAARPAPAPDAEEPAAEAVVIKGSKRPDAAPDTEREDPQVRNRARIDELKRKAAEGGTTGTWEEAGSKELGFKILMPGKGVRSDKRLGAASDAPVVHIVSFEPSEKRYYSVSWIERGPATAKLTDDQLTEQIANGQAQSAHGRLVESRSIEVDGYTGRETRVDTSIVTVRTRVLVVGHRIYQVIAATPVEDSGSREVFKFLESFKVLR